MRGRSGAPCISTNQISAQVKPPRTANIYPHLDAEPTAAHPSIQRAVLLRLCQGKDFYSTVVHGTLVCPQP